MDKKPIEDIFNECCEKIMAGMRPEEVVRHYPQYADELRELLGVAQAIKNTPPLKISDEKLLSCLIKVGVEIQKQRENPLSARLSRLFLFPSMGLMRGFALTVAIIFAAWGTINASAGSLPGEPLYPIKLLTEKATYLLTVNPEAQMELKITFSERRSKELVKKFNRDGAIDIQTLKTMLYEAAQPLDVVVKLPAREQKIYLPKLHYLSNYQKNMLQDLKQKTSDEQRLVLDKAILLCQQRCAWLQKACDKACLTTTPGCVCPLPKKMSSQRIA